MKTLLLFSVVASPFPGTEVVVGVAVLPPVCRVLDTSVFSSVVGDSGESNSVIRVG